MLEGNHPIAFFEGSASIRTLSDALAQLELLQPNVGKKPVILKARRWRLPDGKITSFISMLGPKIRGIPQVLMSLPVSARIVATTTTDCRLGFDSVVLNDARTDRQGNLRLRNGAYLHSVKFVPTKIMDLTRRHREIVKLAILCSKGEEVCIRRLHSEVSYYGVDFAMLPKVKWARISEIENYIAEHTRYASRHEITAALAIAGI